MEAVVEMFQGMVEAEAVEEGIMGAEAEVARVTGQAVAAAVAMLRASVVLPPFQAPQVRTSACSAAVVYLSLRMDGL